MKKYIIIALCSIALVGILIGAAVLYTRLSDGYAPDSIAEEKEKDQNDDLAKAPNFTVYDEFGKQVNLSDFKGKPVVLNFWASWYGPCKSEMPAFEAAYKELGDEIHFLMINLTDGRRETVGTAQEFLDTTDYTFPVYYDLDLSAAMQYTSNSIPITYFINSDGEMVAYASGAISADMLAQGIGMIR